ncbi:hypothetical protein FOZ76_16600 [Verticiella sediminum]|uniref:Uncharacterized protein n=1 Tax=Verticiella sediminum TaxID=1247510 RepID=A0A556AJH0_9BURK|nr:hypothetical protein [Verticiella sediminum]TSH93005.1 hypothetical protein FOZ76_16600 [Verticiella sediminum]
MNTVVAQSQTPRMSWGAIFAGVSLSLVVYLLLGVLGTAVTVTLANPLAPGSGAGTGPYTGLWVVASTAAAVACGSYFAGRFANNYGALHGLLSWALTTLLTVYIFTSSAGGIFGMAASAAAEGLLLAPESLSWAAWWTLTALLVGAVIATTCGHLGYRGQLLVYRDADGRTEVIRA